MQHVSGASGAVNGTKREGGWRRCRTFTHRLIIHVGELCDERPHRVRIVIDPFQKHRLISNNDAMLEQVFSGFPCHPGDLIWVVEMGVNAHAEKTDQQVPIRKSPSLHSSGPRYWEEVTYYVRLAMNQVTAGCSYLFPFAAALIRQIDKGGCPTIRWINRTTRRHSQAFGGEAYAFYVWYR